MKFLFRTLFCCDNTLYSQMLHECIWPYLIGWGLLQGRCVCSLGLSAVSTQIMHHLILCVQGQTLCRNKRLVEHLIGTKAFLEILTPLYLKSVRLHVAPLNGCHILHSLVLVGQIYHISKHLGRVCQPTFLFLEKKKVLDPLLKNPPV